MYEWTGHVRIDNETENSAPRRFVIPRSISTQNKGTNIFIFFFELDIFGVCSRSARGYVVTDTADYTSFVRKVNMYCTCFTVR